MGNDTLEEIHQARRMQVEAEPVAHLPHALAQRGHGFTVVQLARQALDAVEEHPDAEAPRQRLRRHDGVAVVELDHRQPGRGQGRRTRRDVQVVPVGAPDIAAVPAAEHVQPAGVVLRELAHPPVLVDVLVQVQVLRRQRLRLGNPFAPLALRKVSIEMQVDAVARQLGDRGRMQPDRPPRHHGVHLPARARPGCRQQGRALVQEPGAARQVAVEYVLEARRKARGRTRGGKPGHGGGEPVAHLGTAVDAAVRQPHQVGQQWPGALLDADEGAFLEMPDEGNIRRLHQHLVGEGHGLPVELGIDDVGFDARHRLAPAMARQLLDLAEGQRPDRVVPVRGWRP